MTTEKHDAHRAVLADFAVMRRAILAVDRAAAPAAIDRLREADVPSERIGAELIDSVQHAAAYQAAGVTGARTSPASEHPAAEARTAASAQARQPGPRSPAAEHTAAAEDYCKRHSSTSLDARAITHTLLYLGAVIEGAIDAAAAAPVPLWRRVFCRRGSR
jgi:hypothetical protein